MIRTVFLIVAIIFFVFTTFGVVLHPRINTTGLGLAFFAAAFLF